MGIFSIIPWPEIIIRLILAVLGVYRLAHAFSLETGPGGWFMKVREAAIHRYGFDSWQAEFCRCPLCQSFWLAFLFTFVVFPLTTFTDFVMVWGGIAGIVLILHLKLYQT